ncbi:thymidylate synthase [Anaerosacchariphilus polymeriproducens]|uniref:Thymidylate synthase n=1 Tax=Anaerosacchariphilus polymeriproducens TaxID=1812858 RepID=A0A371ARP3_9FIRM|nr:thymidylate synthase [Anaerosacchariphilus polymeriproducens]RDU22243.1 thymidylate synthase [Anaerosacchariphilus polymeriproducens]
MKYKNFEEAYIENLRETYCNPEFENSPRGYKSRERLNCTIEIENPIERVCYLPARKENIIFNFAEAIWYLSGSNSLEFIDYYASNMKKYSADGKTLKGTAYGPKIFTFGSNAINQWNRLIDIFKEDPDTKRGFVQIFDANEDLHLTNIDVSCTIGLQFFQRKNALYTCGYMRANDAYRGIVSDVFSFTFIQEMLATQMGLKVGRYYHNIATTHVYEPDNQHVERILVDSIHDTVSKFCFPTMPHKNNWDDLKVVLEYEELLRNKKIELSIEKLNKIGIDNYWKQLLLLFSIYQGIYYNNKIEFHLYKYLYPVYQHFVKNRWSEMLKEA